MAWNIELAIIERVENEPADRYVPDVFASTDSVLSFEDATSSVQHGSLSLGVTDTHALLVDVSCRLSGVENLFRQIDSTAANAWIYRISEQPIEICLLQRQLAEKNIGAAQVAAASRIQMASDGESIAIAAMKRRCGISFPEDFFDLQFRVYELG